MEKWQPITGYNGYYEISNEGKVRSKERYIDVKTGITRLVKTKDLKTRVNNCGYRYIRLSLAGITKLYYVHRLVAAHFIPNPNNLPQVNHISGNKEDNGIGNLEWVTGSKNTQNAYDTGLNSHKGGNHNNSVRVMDKITGEVFPTIKDFCIHYGINYSTGRNALNGQGDLSNRIDLTKHEFIKA